MQFNVFLVSFHYQPRRIVQDGEWVGWGAPGLWTKCMTARGSFGNRFLVDVGCGGVIEYGSILLYLFGEGQFV